MFSKILIKLIDQAIVPALLILSVRLVSIVLISYQLDIPFDLSSNGGFLFNSGEQLLKINSYSIMAMIVALAIGLSYMLVKSLVFHSSHITPQATAKVFSLKISFFIQNSYDIYTQGAVWLSYSYLLTLASGIMLLFNLVYAWVFYVGLATSLITSVLFAIDIEKELEIEKNSDDLGYYEDDEETFVLNFGDDYV